ncbi:MAG TPA: aminopeptidase [Bacillota bacterium]|nr:aminopeptidase [Bacillota bacterium]
MNKEIEHVKELVKSESVVLKDAATRIYSALEVLEDNLTERAFYERARQNSILFGDIQEPMYKNCLLNPDYVKALLPDNPADVISALIAVFQSARKDAILGKEKTVYKKADLLIGLSKELERKIIDRETVICKWRTYWLGDIHEQTDSEVKSKVVKGKDNVFEQILLSANSSDFSWIYDYGCFIDNKELELAKFFFAYPEDKLREMAERIVHAFLHGFVSQSRDRRDRHRVLFSYQIGQEALAKQVFCSLRARGLDPVVTEPKALVSGGQYDLDHGFDDIIVTSCDEPLNLMVTIENAFRQATEKYEADLLDVCGMIGITQFGMPTSTLERAENAFHPTTEETMLMKKVASIKRSIESKYLAPSDLSFCKVAFPNMLFGERFNDVFNDVFALNLVDSEPYEKIQQVIIDALDKCEKVRVLGCGDNKTDISISIFEIDDPERETVFLNCGGDLNIPHGEVFTTPVLKETKGIWHVPGIYLGGRYYEDLVLVFDEGRIIDYSCENYEDRYKNREYIERELLFPYESLPIGEFAIGSNTKAYQIAMKHDLFSRLPILLAEKMGPHIAIGDPCFARSEDAPVYNLYNKKEMIARYNEITFKKNADDAYTNKHIDITLPYDQIRLLAGYTRDGHEIEIIRNGRFVLKGTEQLNVPLDELSDNQMNQRLVKGESKNE